MNDPPGILCSAESGGHHAAIREADAAGLVWFGFILTLKRA
jgi:hypothetical protein